MNVFRNRMDGSVAIWKSPVMIASEIADITPASIILSHHVRRMVDADLQLKERVLASLVPDGVDPVGYLSAYKDRIRFAIQNDREFLMMDDALLGEFCREFSGGTVTFSFTPFAPQVS